MIDMESAVRWIGLSHLLQPPLALLLIRRIELSRALAACPPVVAQVGRNMALASIMLPTALGLVLALHPGEVVAAGGLRSLAWVVSAFWSWRLVRQWRGAAAFRGAPGAGGAFHWGLSAIFIAQGPAFALLLLYQSFR